MENSIFKELMLSIIESDEYLNTPIRQNLESLFYKELHEIEKNTEFAVYNSLGERISNLQRQTEECCFQLGFKYAIRLLCECLI